MSESTIKAFDILFHISRSLGEMTLARLSRETGINKATALRYLVAMESKGVVTRKGQGWTLGIALFELGSRVQVRTVVAERARPALVALAEEFSETVNLAVYSAGSCLYLDKIEGGKSLRMKTDVGDRLPAHATGVGKAILSILDPKEWDFAAGGEPYARFTEKTIGDRLRLEREILNTRKRGWAIDREEFERGLVCISAPVQCQRIDFRGAVSVSGPSVRVEDMKDKIAQAVVEAADRIKRSLEAEA